MKIKFLTVSEKKLLEDKIEWRIFKVLYFFVAFFVGCLYSWSESWYSTNCPSIWAPNNVCINYLSWPDWIISTLLIWIISIIIFSFIKKIAIYIFFYDKNKK